MIYVVKRDGRIMPFNLEKIKTAILKAFQAVDGNVTPYAETKAENIANYIEGFCEDIEEPQSIEEIQDLVENGLMSTKRKDVAKAYIKYREERSKQRNWNNMMMQAAKDKLSAKKIDNQNANVDENSFGGRKGEFDSVIMKQFALDNCMSKTSKEHHLNNIIYIHDLDSYAVGMHNCLSIPFDDLLAKGFNTRQTDVRPANSISTAFQLVAVLFQIQSLQQFGGVSATHLDWTMVPYVRKSFYKHYIDGLKYISKKEEMTIPVGIGDKTFKLNELPKETLSKTDINDTYIYNNKEAYQYARDMTIKELNQAVEGMYHNLK